MPTTTQSPSCEIQTSTANVDSDSDSIRHSIDTLHAKYLSRGVAAVGKDGLSRNPLTTCDEEGDEGSNVLDVGQAAAEGLALVVRDGVVRLLGVEECCSTVSWLS